MPEPLVSGPQLLLKPRVLLLEPSVLFLELLVFFAKLTQLDQFVSKDTDINLLLPWLLGFVGVVDDIAVLVKDAGLLKLLVRHLYVVLIFRPSMTRGLSLLFLPLLLVSNVHPDNVVASLRDANVFGET